MTVSRQFGNELDSDEWEAPAYVRHPRCIPILAGTEDEAGSQMLEPRYRARRATWTAAAPTEPGWWFVCTDGTEDRGVPVRVERFNGTLRWTRDEQRFVYHFSPGLLWADQPSLAPGKD